MPFVILNFWAAGMILLYTPHKKLGKFQVKLMENVKGSCSSDIIS